MGLTLVNDLAEIGAVLQYQVERTAREWLAADVAARSTRPRLALDALRFKLLLQQPHRAEFGIAAEDRAHDFRFAADDAEPVVLDLIPERGHAAHPHPLLFRGGDLVADALADDLTLELRKGQQHVQRQATHRRRRVELLRDRDKGGVPRIEDLDDLGKSASERVSRSIL